MLFVTRRSRRSSWMKQNSIRSIGHVTVVGAGVYDYFSCVDCRLFGFRVRYTEGLLIRMQSALPLGVRFSSMWDVFCP